MYSKYERGRGVFCVYTVRHNLLWCDLSGCIHFRYAVMVYRCLHSMAPVITSLKYLFHSHADRQHVPLTFFSCHLNVKLSNCPPMELVFSAFLVHQFGITFRKISETHHVTCMLLGDVSQKHSFVLVINSCCSVAL